MKVVVRRSMKLDLPFVLACCDDYGTLSTNVLLDVLEAHFGCRRRAAQDALSILRTGGWLETYVDPRDTRRRLNEVTQKGRLALGMLDGWRQIRIARWLHSSTSTRARRLRKVREKRLETGVANIQSVPGWGLHKT